MFENSGSSEVIDNPDCNINEFSEFKNIDKYSECSIYED